MATQAYLDLAQSLYIAYYGRAADQGGLEFWADKIQEDGLEPVLADFGNSAEFQDRFGDLSNEELVDNLYQQLFDRSADIEGLQFYVGVLESGDKNLAEIAYEILQGAQEPDSTTLANKLDAANAYTAAAGDDYVLEDGIAAVSDANVEAPDLTLTQRADDLQGTDGDDVFTAPVTQNETGSGQLANTFETGDKIDGGEGTDSLEATLIASGAISGAGLVTPPVAAETTSVENVFLTAQQPNLIDSGVTNPSPILFGATVDAGNMVGVEQWWSDNSRADILIEDIVSNPADTAFGMRDTDPGVNYRAYFNANAITAPVTETESALTLTIQDITNDQAPATDELANITVREINFSLEGEAYTLASDDMQAADTWAELEAAIAAQLGENGLAGVTVEHRGNGVFVLEDANSGTFEVSAEEALIFGAASDVDVRNRVELGEPQQIEGQTETAIVLDGAGNGSQGGMIDVGTMSGDRGIEVFNTTVLSDSHITGMMSSNLRNGDQYLEEVLVDGQGDLTIGSTDANTIDGRAQNGLFDIRVLDASELDGSLNAGIVLTDAGVTERYLDDAEDVVDFSVTGTANDDIVTVDVDENISDDPDFALAIDTGAGDDRVNLTGDNAALENTSLEGGEGFDTLEVSEDIGTDDRSTPAAFAGFEKLVLAGTTDIDADMAGLPGIEQVWVATNGGDDSTISNLAADTSLTISGKNQTLADGDGNADQSFDDIVLDDAEAEAQVVNIDNTARNNGVLTIAGLEVSGADSNVDSLEVVSGGRRDTSNVVQDIDAAEVATLTFTGSQDLAAHVSDIGGAGEDITIDASALEGDLTLAVNAGELVNGADDVITGTAGENDILALYGAGGNIDTTINGIETIQFGWTQASDDSQFGGLFGSNVDGGAIGTDAATMPITFNAANAADTDTFIIALRGASNGLTLDNLSSGSNVILGEEPGSAVSFNTADNTLIGTGELNLSLESVVANGAQTNVEGFTTVNFDVASDGTARTHTLNLDENARDLFITGGGELGDALDLNVLATVPGDEALPPSLSVVDFSGYEGVFTATVGDAGADNTDTRFVFSSDHNATISLIDTDVPGMADGWLYDGTNDYNAIFEFSEPTNGPVTWTINNFVTEAEAGGNLGAISVLDMSDLGVNNYAELTFNDTGADLEISTTGADWTINLTGVNEADLESSQNFFFS
ncbi:DUF4214 domain-containing protein [Halomonas sp.]|uniref:DUF4214 domain-containing protein n=1 Tax=Halomonas sp. TaxID=1486246 RepID=UPI003D0996FF